MLTRWVVTRQHSVISQCCFNVTVDSVHDCVTLICEPFPLGDLITLWSGGGYWGGQGGPEGQIESKGQRKGQSESKVGTIVSKQTEAGRAEGTCHETAICVEDSSERCGAREVFGWWAGGNQTSCKERREASRRPHFRRRPEWFGFHRFRIHHYCIWIFFFGWSSKSILLWALGFVTVSTSGPKVSNPMWYKSSNTFGIRVDGVQKITVPCLHQSSMPQRGLR